MSCLQVGDGAAQAADEADALHGVGALRHDALLQQRRQLLHLRLHLRRHPPQRALLTPVNNIVKGDWPKGRCCAAARAMLKRGEHMECEQSSTSEDQRCLAASEGPSERAGMGIAISPWPHCQALSGATMRSAPRFKWACGNIKRPTL